MTGKNNVIRTGLCAYGMSGQVFHAPFLHCMREFDFSAVTERHEKKARAHYAEVRSYDTVGDMLSDESVDLVVVNTPNVTHYDYTKKALEAGKDVIVEKPFAATCMQAEELIKLAEKLQRYLVVYQNRRWDSDFRTVKEVMKKELLGTLIEAEIHYDRYRRELNDKKKHKEIPATGVGLIYDLGPHLIDEAIVLFGKPQSVFALLQAHRPASQVNDYFEIKLLYDQFTCTLKSSLLVREKLPGYILHGTAGSFIKSRADVQEAALQEGISPCIPGWGEEPEAEQGILHTEINGRVVRERYPSVKGDYKEFYKKVYKSLTDHEASPVPLEDSLLNIRIIEAAIRSSREKAVVQL